MLNSIEDIMNEVKKVYPANIHLSAKHFIVNNEEDLAALSEQYGEQWDLVMAFKSLSELPEVDNVYYQFARDFGSKLSPNGLMVILDVTTRDNLIDYNPILLNSAINKLEKEETFKTVIPVSCGYYGGKCNRKCFTQQQFLISHSHRRNDLSKVAYRVIARKKFAGKILTGIENSYFVVKWKHNGNGHFEPAGVCAYSNRSDQLKDAYLLKQ
jgi:hypothetical protein